MLIKDVAGMSTVRRLVYWIQERHEIYLRRGKGLPPPWTDDEVLQTQFFTNPYRENDKTTLWVKDNIRNPLNNDDRVAFATLAFRWFNLPATGSLLLGRGMQLWNKSWPRTNLLVTWNTQHAVNRLTAYKNTGRQVFTGAFNISNSGSTKPKVNRVCEDYVGPAWDYGEDLVKGVSGVTLAEAHRHLRTYPGLGGSGFMAAQVVCDLKYTHLLRGAEDWWSWCSPGPGSRRGLNLVMGRSEDARCHNFLQEVNGLRRTISGMCKDMEPLHSQDIQNCLCEFYKYERARHTGRSKRTYPGSGKGD